MDASRACSVVKTRAAPPSVLSRKVSMASCPVCRWRTFCMICGSRLKTPITIGSMPARFSHVSVHERSRSAPHRAAGSGRSGTSRIERTAPSAP